MRGWYKSIIKNDLANFVSSLDYKLLFTMIQKNYHQTAAIISINYPPQNINSMKGG